MTTKTEVGKCELCEKTAACTDVNGQWICLQCQKDNGKPGEQPKAEQPEQTTTITTRTIETGNRGLALRTIEDIYRFANCVARSGLAPSSYKTPEQIIIAVQTGAERGMGPMQSLNSFCVVNGAARMFGDAPLSEVRKSKLMEYIKERIEGEGDERVAVCETKRKGDPEPKVTRFSVTDAKLAGLWDKKTSSGKPTPWVLYPERMLMFRARSFNLRDNFPDALAGITIAEEYEGVELSGNGLPHTEDEKPKSAALLEDEEHALSAQE